MKNEEERLISEFEIGFKKLLGNFFFFCFRFSLVIVYSFSFRSPVFC